MIRGSRGSVAAAAGLWVAVLSAVAAVAADGAAAGRPAVERAGHGSRAAAETRAPADGPSSADRGHPADASAAADTAVRVRRRVHAMGTMLTGTAWADRRTTGVDALEAAVLSVEAMEDRLSTWRDDTELAVLNAAPRGRAAAVGDTLFGLLEDALHWREATDGAFDPAVGSLVEAWDLRREGRIPGAGELRAAREAAGMGCWELDAGGRTVTPRCEGAWIDAGAFGKGAAFRPAGRALRAAGVEAGLLDFGGQFLAVGCPPGQDGWRIAVAHPSERDRPVAALRVADRSVATSSASERFVVVEGEPRGHVLDPRTGEPVPPWGSVTVVAEDPLAADALSTGLFVLGPDGARAWAEGREDVGVLVLEEREDGGLEAAWNGALERHLAERPRAAGRAALRSRAGSPGR